MSDDRLMQVIQTADSPLSMNELLPLCLAAGVPVDSINPTVWSLVEANRVRFTPDWKVEAVPE